MPSILRLSLLSVYLCVLATSISAFGVVTPTERSSTELGMFGGLKKAFANDDNLGKAQNAGLSGGPDYNESVTVNGKPVKAIVGQKVSVVANAARVKISYNCQNGECGTCAIKVNGRKALACQATIPKGKCNIQTP
mmetsp:Transcript_14438/g.20349  ORF Transcript_14438/g.20349 Transcript_14438/m.20349 type:complete len:136 (+) Transcript_14438:167-574(+)